MTWVMKTFTRNSAPCSNCHEKVEQGSRGWTNSEQPRGERVRCLKCGPLEVNEFTDKSSPTAELFPDPVAGTSALRQDKRYRGDANLRGAQGEYLMGGYLAGELTPGSKVLTDRKVPDDSDANIDHIVVASSGIWVIDSKKWTGEIRYRSPGFPSTDPNRYLSVGGVDRTSAIAKIYRLVIPVAKMIGDRTVPIYPAIAFIDPTWGLREILHFQRGKGPYQHEGVLIAGGHGIIKKINELGPLSNERVDELWRKLDKAMPPR